MRTLLITLFLMSFACLTAQVRKPGHSKKLENAKNDCITITGADGVALTVLDIVELLVGPGVEYSNVSFQAVLGGDNEASIGMFDGNACNPIGFDQGVILSSGTVGNALGPNEFDDITAALGLPGDAGLDALTGGIPTLDATVLEFDFIPNDNAIFIQYVFGSEEYNEYIGEIFNDVFGFFVNGQNIALIPGTNTPVAINNINNGFATEGEFASGPCTNCEYYRDNADLQNPPYEIECDGLTTVLTATAMVLPNETNTVKLAIADAGDDAWDSWVFIRVESFSTIIQVPGDANCDGEVDVLDVVTIINYILGFNPDPFCPENADANEDGDIDVLDVVTTINIILSGE